MRIMQMGDHRPDLEASPTATVMITADTSGVGLLEFHQMDRPRGRTASGRGGSGGPP